MDKPDPPIIPFPKIGEFGGFEHAYKALLRNKQVAPGPVKLTGTVKLHGTHADMVVYWDNTIVFQSRNKIIKPGLTSDNHGCATTLGPLCAQILALRNQFAERFEKINGKGSVKKDTPVISKSILFLIALVRNGNLQRVNQPNPYSPEKRSANPSTVAGEWVGHKVQPAVALSSLKNRVFVIIGCKISNIWVSLEKYHDLNNEAVGIYNISRSGFKTITVKIDNNNVNIENAKAIIMESTLRVEKECPWTKLVFNISGVGEGVVWKPDHPLGADPKYWFKSKGQLHRNSNTEELATVPGIENANPEKKARMFAEKALTENRLNQGMDVMREMHMEFRRDEAEREFLTWLFLDIATEENRLLIEMDIDPKFLEIAIRAIGGSWYKANLGRLFG